LGARDVDVLGDSNLIAQQIRVDSKCLDEVLNSYQDNYLDIIVLFDTFSIKHTPLEENSRANRLAQQALGSIVSQGIFWVALVSLVEHRYALRSKGKSILEDSDRLRDKEKLVVGNTNPLPGNNDRLSGKADLETEPSSGMAEPGPSYECGLQEELEPILGQEDNEESVTKKSESERFGSPVDKGKMEPIKLYDSVKGGDTIQTDWRLPLLKCIRDPRKSTDKKVKQQVLKYTSIDDELYRRTIDSVLLKCSGEEQAKVVVREVHDGICGAHQLAYKMNWLLWRAGFYWPTMMDDCVKYQKGCEACQRLGNIQFAPAGIMNSIVKLWPFRGWGLDFVGEIHPRSYKGHRFILVGTDYFTKWTEAVPFRNMTRREVISFV
jgi:hypothetical protein